MSPTLGKVIILVDEEFEVLLTTKLLWLHGVRCRTLSRDQGVRTVFRTDTHPAGLGTKSPKRLIGGQPVWLSQSSTFL